MSNKFVFDWDDDPLNAIDVPVGLIDLDPDNPRGPKEKWDKGEYEDLKSDIEEHGIQMPIELRPGRAGRAVATSGNRRLSAAKEVGLEVVPCFLNGKGLSFGETLRLRFRDERFQSKWPPTCRAKMLADAVREYDGSVAKAAKATKLSVTSVRQALSLLNLPKAIQHEIDAGRIDATAGYLLVEIGDAAEQRQAAMDLMKGGITAVQLRNRLRGEDSSISGSRRHRASFNGVADIRVSISWGDKVPTKAQKRRALESALRELNASE